MPDLSFFVGLLREQYGVQQAAIQPLAHATEAARALLRVNLPGGETWVVRAHRADQAVPEVFAPTGEKEMGPWLASRAATLALITAQAFPAPRLVRTHAGALTGQAHGWCTLVTTYLSGAAPAPTLDQLRQMGGALGRLHSLRPRMDGLPPPGRSWYWAPGVFEQAQVQLELIAPAVPIRWLALHTAFRQTCASLAQAVGSLPETLVHGDVWARNAVATATGEVLLLDWETGGLGLAVLDLARLLLECHLDASQPAGGLITPDSARVAAVAAGYCQHRRPAPAELEALPQALRFTAAVIGAAQMVEAARGGWNESADRRLDRAQNRYDVSDEVARLARLYLRSI